MKILYIAKFRKMWDEEYIARGFESLGHTVGRVAENSKLSNIVSDLNHFKPDIVIFAKLFHPQANSILQECKNRGIKTVSWVFDLYWGYQRENQLRFTNFKADYVFTTDGGDHIWGDINHNCVRQGIQDDECVLVESKKKKYDVIFVGSYNPYNKMRNKMIEYIKRDFKFEWFGKSDSDEVRGMKLNRLYAKTKIVIGDSVYSPHYWSNRVVETLGRGGFLIHQEVEGLKEAYPHLVTYKRGDYEDLKAKIDYYLENDDEREKIIKLNHKWVKDNYTCSKQCKKLIEFIK